MQATVPGLNRTGSTASPEGTQAMTDAANELTPPVPIDTGAMEACEVWNYAGCAQQESNPRVKALWEQFVDYELGHLQAAIRLYEEVEGRDAAELLGDGKLPPFIQFRSQREFVRKVVQEETHLRKRGTEFVDEAQEGTSSLQYRQAVNAGGSPSETVSATYSWTPGTELMREPVIS